jgi:hypothetical protein
VQVLLSRHDAQSQAHSPSAAVTLNPGGTMFFSLRARTIVPVVGFILLGSGTWQPESSQAAVRSGGNPVATARKLCKGIPRHDIAPLFKGAVTGPNPGTAPIDSAVCGFPTAGSTYSTKGSSGTFAVVTIAIGGDGLYFQTKAAAKAHPLSGIGDKAIWNFNGPIPQMVATKGDEVCYVSINGVAPEMTLTYTVSGGNTVVSAAAGKTYAQKMGPICKDVFKGK